MASEPLSGGNDLVRGKGLEQRLDGLQRILSIGREQLPRHVSEDALELVLGEAYQGRIGLELAVRLTVERALLVRSRHHGLRSPGLLLLTGTGVPGVDGRRSGRLMDRSATRGRRDNGRDQKVV